MKIWIGLFLLSVLFYNFISVMISYCLIALLFYIIAKELYIIGSVSFNLGTIKGSHIYFRKITGPYKNSNSYFEESCKILTKFNLKEQYEYNTFGFYIDDPKKVDEEKCRSVIGIIYTPSEANKPVNNDLVTFLQSEGFFASEFPISQAIVSRLPIVSWSLCFLAISRFYKDLERQLLDKDWVKKMRFDVEKIPGIIELCKMKSNSNIIEFYIPNGNQDKFNFFDTTK